MTEQLSQLYKTHLYHSRSSLLPAVAFIGLSSGAMSLTLYAFEHNISLLSAIFMAFSVVFGAFSVIKYHQFRLFSDQDGLDMAILMARLLNEKPDVLTVKSRVEKVIGDLSQVSNMSLNIARLETCEVEYDKFLPLTKLAIRSSYIFNYQKTNVAVKFIESDVFKIKQSTMQFQDYPEFDIVEVYLPKYMNYTVTQKEITN